MILFLSAQDIHELQTAVTDQDGRVLHHANVSAPPEAFLSSLEAERAAWGIEWDELDAIVVVTGPGSFTSCRIVVTIANGIGFARLIPIVGIENAERHSLLALIDEGEWKARVTSRDLGFAVPVYDRPPNITKRRA